MPEQLTGTFGNIKNALIICCKIRRCCIVQTTFDTPWGNDPVTLNLSSMGKGEVWINGESIGRYWVSFRTPSGQPSQSLSVQE